MLEEGQRLSHYTIIRLLRNGGMGEVYLAKDTLLKRLVAIKIIHTNALQYAEIDAAKDAARLFLREAQAIAQLDHSNILPLYDSGEQIVNGISLMYMVMPYRQAGSLADWKSSHFGNRLLPLAAVERIVEQAALALQHAHDRQIIHQDVKPSNFLVQGEANHPGELHLQLADFGVARVMMTSESQVIRGTPAYMAPEQWDGRPVPATDQYALAVMAYEFLTGSLPFVGQNYQQMWNQHVNVDPTPPSIINPTLPQELDAVFLRALQKNPARRYSSVLAFAHAFQQAVLQSGNVQQTITISPLEARTGTNRVILIHNGRQVIVPIPAGVNHGQVIRLEGYGRHTTYNNPVGALIVTINISPVVAMESAPPMAQTFQPTVPAFNTLAHKNIKPALPPVPLKKRRTKNSTILRRAMIALACVLLLLSVPIGYFVNTKYSVPSPKIATSNSIPYPSYLPGKGIFAAYDSLKNDGKGMNWSQTPGSTSAQLNGSCLYLKNTLYAMVNGETGATFHPCIPVKTSVPSYTIFYSDFAYQVKMTIVIGDCGGVTFREQGAKLYYFFICQRSNYKCHNNGAIVCNYGLIRYTQNPPTGYPDFNLNPLLTEGFSKTVEDGANQQYTIVVVARKSKIDLFVNGQNIGEVKDNVYTKGVIGVLAKTFGPYSTQVVFSDATVWTF
ncbi:MAG: serine/threonine protein kinase [Ktedonobacteraceae bacterium]